MKRTFILIAAFACIICLTACCGIIEPNVETLPAVPQQTEPTPETDPVTEPATEPATEPVTQPPETEPEHSELYIPGLPVEDVILYFNEVCLDAEMVFGGDPSRLQKWDSPIYYQLNGSYTQEDLAVLTGFTDWLNTVEGFPGIYESQDPLMTNLQIYFCSQQEMLDRLGDNFAAMDGGVTFWYEDHQIYDAIICYRTDLSQYLRNSVILEEIYNGLGPIQDTALRSDSIIYSEYTQPQSLTEIDELLLKLLYHPQLQCGMNAEECEAVIRQLYY